MKTPTQDTYEQLKSKIINGEFFPSQSLKEQQLADALRVSRNTIKKALMMLERENFVVIEANRGAHVRAYTVGEVLDLMEYRIVLEGYIAAQAALKLTEDDFKHLLDSTISMKTYLDVNEPYLFSQTNQEYHKILFDACPNRIIVERALNLKSRLIRYSRKALLVRGRMNQSYTEHVAIIEALKSKDLELCEALMRQHLLKIRTIFEENYDLLK